LKSCKTGGEVRNQQTDGKPGKGPATEFQKFETRVKKPETCRKKEGGDKLAKILVACTFQNREKGKKGEGRRWVGKDEIN